MATAPTPGTDLRLRAADGIALVGSRWMPGAAPKGALVIVHGLKDHGQRYGELAARATSLGLAVYTYDLRGHGRSEGPRVWVRRFEEYVGDIGVEVADVQARHPGLPVFLFGHSMGGVISAKLVAERRPTVAGVMLSAPALRRSSSVSSVAVGFTKLLSAVAPHAAVFRTRNRDFSRDPAVVRAMDEDPLIFQGAAPARTAAELLRAMATVQEEARGFSAPLLAMHGAADRLTHPAGSREFVTRSASSSKALRIYPELYHDLLHEPERAQVLGDIEEWLRPRLG